MRRLAVALTILLLAAAQAPVRAWGELGHQLVGELAQRQLTPAAQANVAWLLRDEPVPTLAGVAFWADALRVSDPDRFKQTSRWHYVNFAPGSCAFDPPRDCPDGACVVEAIEAQRRLLSDVSQPLEVRRDALKFIVHLVGDVHQPLHSSNRTDKGGNQFQIILRTDIPPEEYARDRYHDGVMDTNLHSVWDYYVLASAGLSLQPYADRLASSKVPATKLATPAAWAAESCKLIDRHRLYPRSGQMDKTYLSAMRPYAERRIVQAARRLAKLLNETFTTAAPAP
jgi:hypothetical protein